MIATERNLNVLVSPAIDRDGLRKRVVCDVTFFTLLSLPASVFDQHGALACFGHSFVDFFMGMGYFAWLLA